MRTEMSSLDLMFLLIELRFLRNGKIGKIYQKNKTLRIEIYLSGKGTFELFYEPNKIFVSEYKRKAEEHPEAFSMFLRKHIRGQRIISIKQHDFERIIELETEKNILIFEVFSKGNAILCDKNYKIIMPLEIQTWKDRQILPKKQYQYPPAVSNPFKLKNLELSRLLKSSGKELVRFLAIDLSFSGLYAEEICARANIEKSKLCNKLSEREIARIDESIDSLLKQFGPQIILDNKKPVDVVPFDMKIYEGEEIQRFTTFTHALDEFFTKKEIVVKEIKEEKEFEDEIQKFQRVVQKQKEAIEKWENIENESRQKAKAIYDNYELIQNIISEIHELKEKGLKWKDIKEKLKDKVKEIKERKGTLILDID